MTVRGMPLYIKGFVSTASDVELAFVAACKTHIKRNVTNFKSESLQSEIIAGTLYVEASTIGLNSNAVMNACVTSMHGAQQSWNAAEQSINITEHHPLIHLEERLLKKIHLSVIVWVS